MQEQHPDDENFWTPGLKALVALNIFFITLIIIGLVAVAAAFSPFFYNLVLDWWNK
jgi:hypothetical protein